MTNAELAGSFVTLKIVMLSIFFSELSATFYGFCYYMELLRVVNNEFNK